MGNYEINPKRNQKNTKTQITILIPNNRDRNTLMLAKADREVTCHITTVVLLSCSIREGKS